MNMNYTEWRDELNNNLLSVSEAERRRVLDYYAEAYADRREAGFSEKEIISGFGAPYDAAQRILYDKGDDVSFNKNSNPPPVPPQPYAGGNAAAARPDNTWIFVLLCVIFCIPLFSLIMTMIGLTIGFCCAPIAVIGSGIGLVGSSLGIIVGGSVGYGLYLLGGGLATIGVGVILCPICYKLVKFMWKLFVKLFNWLKSLFSGKV